MRIALAILVAGVSLHLALEMWRNAALPYLPNRDVRTEDERFLEQSDVAAGARITRRFVLRVDASWLRAMQRLDVRGDANLCSAIHRSALQRELVTTRDPVEWVTGEIVAGKLELRFKPPVVIAAEGASDCTMTAEGEERLFRHDNVNVIVFDPKLPAHELEVAFEARDVRVADLTKPPATARGPVFHWAREPQRVSFRVTRIGGTTPRVGDVVTSVDQNWLPYLNPPLTTFLTALPFALFVLIGRRHATEERRQLVEMAAWLLSLYLVLHLTYTIVSVGDWIFDELLEDRLPPFASGDTFGSILIAFACVVWPLLVARWWRNGRPAPSIAEPGPAIPREAIAALAAFAIACGVAIFAEGVAVSAAGIVALAAGCYWLVRELGGGVPYAVALLLTASAVFLLREHYAPVLTPPLAALLLLGLIAAVYAGFRPVRRLSPGELAVFALAAAIGVLLFLPSSLFAPYAEIHSLAHAATSGVLLALAAAFLLLLRDHSAAGGSSTAAVDLGFAFALAIFYNHRWGVYGAVVVGSGYVLLRYCLFVPETRRSQLLLLDAARIREGIFRLIALHDAERAVDQRRKTMLAKIESGDAKWDEYETSTGELEAVVSEYKQDTEAIETSRQALAHGPVEPPWKRGAYAAGLAAMLAIPWCIGYAAVYSGDDAPSSPQWWLDVIAIFILGLTQWPLFAFFFGYFYPDIRGRNGLGKALVFFVTVAVPPVLAHVLFRAQLPPMIFALWIFQNFIQAMFLGLFAGDYRTLRACGLGWRHLRDVHNLGVLTAYGTSVIVAVGGAIATAVAGGVVDALTKMAK